MEEMFSFLKSQPKLFFIDRFLKTFPKADLFLVGGAVRDLILFHESAKRGLGTPPITDFDFVIRKLSAAEIETWFTTQGSIKLAGNQFIVFKFSPKGFDGKDIDIALPRTEFPTNDSLGGYRDFETQSNPSLAIAKDLARRDFTINAMAFDLRTCELIDPYLGQHDLNKKILRAVGDPDQRFKEDLTRILRGIRFAAQLDFEIEPKTWEAMKRNIPHLNRLRKTEGKNEYVVARETIGEELSKAFSANPSVTTRLLLESGALEELFPSVWRHVQIDSHYLDPLFSISNVREGHVLPFRTNHLEHTIILLLRELTEDEVRTTLASTGLNSIDKLSPRRIETDRIAWVIQKLKQTHTIDTIANMRASQFEKQFMSDQGKLHLSVLNQIEKPHILTAITKRHEEICSRWKCDEQEPIPSLLSGEDIIRLGIPEGMRVRELLEEVRDHQLDGALLSREAAIRFVKQKTE